MKKTSIVLVAWLLLAFVGCSFNPAGLGLPGSVPTVVRRSLSGEVLCTPPERALVLIDERLYGLVYNELRAYVNAACERRGFAIRIMGVDGLDDLRPHEIRNLLIDHRSNHPLVEGVLMVGNVPLPKFFLARTDMPEIKYWPRYYQDLDMVVEKTIQEGAVLPQCTGAADEDGFPSDWPCVAPGPLHEVPFQVGPHDFDDFYQGTHGGIELWTAFLPVGYGVPALDNYAGWADQLKLFFSKAAAYHQNPGRFDRNLYHLGNDISLLGQVETVWDLMGPESIHFYSINTFGPGQCNGNPLCYRRAELEAHGSLGEFMDYANTLPWIGEGWQDPVVFLSHMNASSHSPRRVVWWNVHSGPEVSLISSAQARNDILPGKGGAVALLNGCLVGSFVRPNDSLPPHAFNTPYPHDNIMVSLVYGPSAFIAALGSVSPRGMPAHYGVVLDRIYTDGYLGLADLERSNHTDVTYNTRMAQRGHWDILIGDPFVDAYQCPDGEPSCPSPPSSCPDGPGFYCGSEVGLDADTLYHCLDNRYTVQKTCENGCRVTPSGEQDYCEPLAHCPGGPGLYCGSAVGRDPGVLYACHNGQFTVHELCATGCRENPDGEPDLCEPNGTCPNGNGWYCGSAVGLDPLNLYHCHNGNLTMQQVCVAGCRTAPAGQADYCEPAGACPQGNGWYCGSSVGRDPDILYLCQDGNFSVHRYCANGCHVAPAGEADYCEPDAPCPDGPGWYCGLSAGLDAGILYFCENGNFVVAEHCSAACHVAPAGEADYCEPTGTCPNGPGFYCGAPVGLNANTLYFCHHGNYRIEQYCLNGCSVAPPGEADQCL